MVDSSRCTTDGGAGLGSQLTVQQQVEDGAWLTAHGAIRHGADVHARTGDGLVPLNEAAFYGKQEIISILMQHGADVNAKSNAGFSSLYNAAQEGHVSCVTELIQHGADVNIRTEKGFSPLHSAARSGHADCARELQSACPLLAALYKGEPPFSFLILTSAPCCISAVTQLTWPSCATHCRDEIPSLSFAFTSASFCIRT